MAPDAVTIGSKWGYTYTADWQVTVGVDEAHEVKEHSLPVLERQISESGLTLGSYLDLYQIHSATLSSGVLENDAVLKRLDALRRSGIVIGLSLSGPGQAETLWRALEVEVDGAPLFGSVQATWNLLERSAEKALEAAAGAGWGVIVKEAVANGRLTSRNQDPAFAPAKARLHALAEEQDSTIDALALAAVLAQPWATVVLSGAARVDHLLSNVGALRVTWSDELDAELVDLAEPAAVYWQTRSSVGLELTRKERGRASRGSPASSRCCAAVKQINLRLIRPNPLNLRRRQCSPDLRR